METGEGAEWAGWHFRQSESSETRVLPSTIDNLVTWALPGRVGGAKTPQGGEGRVLGGKGHIRCVVDLRKQSRQSCACVANTRT